MISSFNTKILLFGLLVLFLLSSCKKEQITPEPVFNPWENVSGNYSGDLITYRLENDSLIPITSEFPEWFSFLGNDSTKSSILFRQVEFPLRFIKQIDNSLHFEIDSFTFGNIVCTGYPGIKKKGENFHCDYEPENDNVRFYLQFNWQGQEMVYYFKGYPF